jgi:hypothetical protein
MKLSTPQQAHQFGHFLAEAKRVLRVTFHHGDCFLITNFWNIGPSIYGDPGAAVCACGTADLRESSSLPQ